MNKSGLVMVLVAGMLAACGGGGGGEREDRQPTAEQGVFHGGGIQGLAFRTPTQSGATDAAGRFRYLAGETVTFSLGGIELGSAAGAPTLSLLQLAKAEVPANEAALRLELNRMRTVSTPLSSAANRAWLLLALDADGDPANGLDLRNREESLRDARVNFEVLLARFPEQLDGLAPRTNTAIPSGRPVVHLFRSLGLRFAGGVPSRVFGDQTNDGTDDTQLTTTFDAAGAAHTLSVDRRIDGRVEAVTSYQRGVHGRLREQRIDDDVDGDGESDYSRIVGRDFDVRGNLVLVTERESGDYFPGDALDIRRSATHDEFGRVLDETHETRDAQGTLQHRDRVVFTRDARGNLVLQSGEYDDGADGSVNLRSRKSLEFDAADRVVATDETQDAEDDGRIDWRQLSRFDYDAEGRVTHYKQSTDFDGDGHIDHVSLQRLWYDVAGNIERAMTEVHDDRGGQLSGINEHHFTYDSDRRQLTQVTVNDLGADGEPDERIEVTDRYDARGLKSSREVSWLDPRTGAQFRSSRAEIRYNAAGAEIAETMGWDHDGDGVLETVEALRVEYDAASDALGQIVNDYFTL